VYWLQDKQDRLLGELDRLQDEQDGLKYAQYMLQHKEERVEDV